MFIRTYRGDYSREAHAIAKDLRLGGYEERPLRRPDLGGALAN